jgi:DNA-binding CsgD family transcriptional regulator
MGLFCILAIDFLGFSIIKKSILSGMLFLFLNFFKKYLELYFQSPYIYCMDTVILTNNTVLVTEDELKAIKMYSDGKTAAQVASKLKVSVRTIEGKLYLLRREYKAKTTTHLVSIFLRKGLIK